jgi:hypothetical protein
MEVLSSYRSVQCYRKLCLNKYSGMMLPQKKMNVEFWFEKPEEQRTLRRRVCRWQDNTETCLEWNVLGLVS